MQTERCKQIYCPPTRRFNKSPHPTSGFAQIKTRDQHQTHGYCRLPLSNRSFKVRVIIAVPKNHDPAAQALALIIYANSDTTD